MYEIGVSYRMIVADGACLVGSAKLRHRRVRHRWYSILRVTQQEDTP